MEPLSAIEKFLVANSAVSFRAVSTAGGRSPDDRETRVSGFLPSRFFLHQLDRWCLGARRAGLRMVSQIFSGSGYQVHEILHRGIGLVAGVFDFDGWLLGVYR